MTKTISATKRMLATLLAVLMMFSGMAVSASADVSTPSDPTTPTTPAEPTSIGAPVIVEKSDADKTVIVKLPAVPGYEVKLLSEPNASYMDLKDGTWYYVNLTPGQKYSFKAYIIKSDKKPLYSSAVTVTIKDKHSAPSAPVATKVTATTITAAKVTDCQYRLMRVKDNKVIYNWGDTVVFEKLTANTAYLLSIRKKETSSKYASDPVSITVKTLRAGDAKAVGKPVLVDKTNTTVTVKCAEGDEGKNIEFSIDKGKTWQHSGEFKNLTANTIYGVIARKAYDPALQDPNPSSAILEIRTNTRERYSASLGKCTFTLDEGKVYANELIGVRVTGDGPKDKFLAEYGDTRYIPKEIRIDGRIHELKGSTTEAGVYTGEILPGSNNANKTIKISVIYTVERFNGGTEWLDMGTVESKQEIEVGPEKNIFTVIGEFFVSVANVLFNTIPELILSTGGLWEKGLALLFGMFDDLGITK